MAGRRSCSSSLSEGSAVFCDAMNDVREVESEPIGRWARNDRWNDWAALSEGCYLLRTNLQETDRQCFAGFGESTSSRKCSGNFGQKPNVNPCYQRIDPRNSVTWLILGRLVCSPCFIAADLPLSGNFSRHPQMVQDFVGQSFGGLLRGVQDQFGLQRWFIRVVDPRKSLDSPARAFL